MKNYVVIAIVGALLVLSTARIVNTLNERNAYRARTFQTEKKLHCTSCDQSYPITQNELMRRYQPDSDYHTNGEPYITCSKCNVVSAYLIIEERD